MLAFALLATLALPVVARAEVAIQARLINNRITVGESAPLEVVVQGASGSIGDPQVPLASGMQVLGISRSQTFSWINGKSSASTTFRIELGADRVGTFVVGPIRVRVGSQWYESPSVTVQVVGDREGVPGSSRAPASLLLDLTPHNPYVGQPTILRVRLVQRASLAEDPQYSPPATPGFWSEKSTAPESYYADQGGARVLVTETRSRLYPLAAGAAQVGEANAVLTLAVPASGRDPFDWLTGGGSRRQVSVRSDPVPVAVRALPPGAPDGFDGAVGRFDGSWDADRARTTLDVPVTVWLDIRGQGNLPLVHTPELASPDADVFSSTVQDSLGPAGTLAPGRRRFLWTVLPHRIGTLHLQPPSFSWFDYTSGRYVTLDAPALEIGVEPPLHPAGSGAQVLPTAFAENPVDPFAHAPNAWGFAAAGAALGLSIRALRRARGLRRGARPATPAWMQGLRHSQGAAFWAAAARAIETLAARGVDVAAWRRQVDAARYGGSDAQAGALRDALVSALGPTGGPVRGAAARAWATCVAAFVVAMALLVPSLPRGGDPAAAEDALRADRSVTGGDVESAALRWRTLWSRGARHPAIAARLAWAAARTGALADASAWVLRGDAGEPRDPALSWVTGNVRDAGGLAGFKHARLPIRDLEWALAALACGLGLGWAGRRAVVALVAAAVLLAAAPGLDRARAGRVVRGVVRAPVVLEGEGVELVPGQVVVVREAGPRVAVEVGSNIHGRLPAASVEIVGASR